MSNFLLAYRNAPQCTTNESPARLFIGRSLSSKLDLIRPDVRRKVELKQAEVRERRNSTFRNLNKDRHLLLEIIVRTTVGGHQELL